MHMADALISPTVGVTLWAASTATLAWCSRRIRQGDEERLIPLMGVLGAFVFAVQMINFTIPATGSSGHIGGGLLLSILLGPHAACVVIASILTVQALFFADGGLLALGANIFNLGVFPCFAGYLLVYRPLLGADRLASSQRRITIVATLAAVVGSQLGAFAVVLETMFSGISNLPISTFLLLMQPIHLAIGLVEGLATAIVILFVRRARPDLFMANAASPIPISSRKPLLLALGIATVLTAGVFSWFASTQPDGLEWSIAHAAGSATLPAPESGFHTAQAQHKITGMTDDKPPTGRSNEAAWPAVDSSRSLASLIGAAITLGLVISIGYLLRRRRSSS
ncbi:MAG: energy-coupling factor ABC transporter permease [Sterolibacterium sp.]